MPIATISPLTGETLQEFKELDHAEIDARIALARETFLSYRLTSFGDRARWMREAADLLDAEQDDVGRMMTTEMGKPLAQARAEVAKCATAMRFYADRAERFLADEPADAAAVGASHAYARYQPLGVVLAVMPWNFPLWQVFRFAAPALMAGNAGLLKHASNVSGCALAIERVLHDAGIPPAVFRSLLVGSGRVASIIEAPEVAAVTLTGSTPAGRSVARAAGAALKKTVLELGGSDPYLVLEDADLELAVESCVASRLINGGQSCIAAKRFIVVEAVRTRFEVLFVEKMRSKRMGDPLEEGVDLGPQARRDLRDELHGQVERSVARGARVLLGALLPAGKGAFYPPSVLTDVAPGMPAYDEELFGPVAAIIGVPDEAEAVRVANDSPFGLGAAVFTRDLSRGERIARDELAAGSCFVNAFVKSDPRLPFGGIRESGYGRELSRF